MTCTTTRSLLFALIITIMAGLPLTSIAQDRAEPNYRVIAYADGGIDSWNMNVEMLTHINYSFAKVNDEGQVFFPDELKAAQRLTRLQKLKARNPELKLLVSVGGWGAGGFSDAALNRQSRTIFSKSAVKLIKEYGLDGIDIDWEFPGQPGPGIGYRKADKRNFTLMMKSLRTHLDSLSDKRGLDGKDRLLLTIASNDDQAYFDHTNMSKVHQYLDFVNVMSYDMYTVGSETTGHHAGLYLSAPDRSARTADAAIQRHLEAGIPPHKIVLGAAFYGRSWEGVQPKNNGLYQPFDKFYRFIQYRDLTENYINKNGYRRYWDDTVKAPYLWNKEKQIMVSYENPKSLRYKAEYIKKKGLGGVMYWHHSYDPSQILLKTLYRELQK